MSKSNEFYDLKEETPMDVCETEHFESQENQHGSCW